MRKLMLPFAIIGLLASPMLACDVEDTADGDTSSSDTTTTDGTTTDTGPGETVTGPTYAAVIVDDSQIFPTHRVVGTDPCATASSPLNAHGADIDAVGLFSGATLIGYFDFVDYQEGGLCPNKQNTRTDPDDAKGAPDASLTEGFVSLGGGFLIGEFSGGTALESGDIITVYEVGSKCGNNTSCGGVDEGYEVFVATELDCVNQSAYPYGSCAIKLSDTAKGEANIPVSGF